MANTAAILKFAYKKAFGLTDDEVKKPEHEKRIKEALNVVWTYPKPYPGETEIMCQERLDMRGPSKGDWTELAHHLKNVFGDEFDNMTSYEVIFTVYSRMIEAGTDTADKVSVPESEVEEVPLNSIEEASSLINHFNKREDSKMDAQNQNVTAEDILNGMVQDGVKSTENSKPTTKANLREKVVNEKFEQERADRIAMSKKALITSIILNCPPSQERAVQGAEAKGTVVEAAKKLDKFVKTFGVVEDPATGEVTMSTDKIPESEMENAIKTYNALKQAANDPTLALSAKTTTKRGVPRALGFDGIESVVQYMTKKEAKVFLYNKTAGEVHSNTSMFIQISAVKEKPATNNREVRTESTPKSATTLQLCNYNSLKDEDVPADFFKLAQVCDTEAAHEFDPKFRAVDYGFKYYSEKASSQDANKKRLVTYPLTLSVEVYALKDNPDSAVAEYKGKAAGGPKVPTNFDDAAAVEKKMSDLAKWIAKDMQNNVTDELGDFVGQINVLMDQEEQKTQQSQVELTE